MFSVQSVYYLDEFLTVKYYSSKYSKFLINLWTTWTTVSILRILCSIEIDLGLYIAFMDTCMEGFAAANFLFIAYSFSATFPPKYRDNYASYTHLQALPHRESKRITQQSRNTNPVCTNVPVFPFLVFDLYPSVVAQLGFWFPGASIHNCRPSEKLWALY